MNNIMTILYDSNDQFIIKINKNYKPVMIKRRKEFMELLLMIMGGEKATEAIKRLKEEFGTTLLTEMNPANSISLLVDGEIVFRT